MLVFAHGSLMFHRVPAPVAGPGRAIGWSRRFGHPSVRNWGTDAAPAPTCCLVEGGEVSGLVLSVDRRSLAAIAAREASEPVEIEVETDGTRTTAYTWTMRTTWADRHLDDLAGLGAANVAAGGGPSGDALDYATGVCETLRRHGLADLQAEDYLTRLRELASAPGRGSPPPA